MDLEEYDPEEDAMPSESLVLKRRVEEDISGDIVIIEAQITRHDDQEDGITFLKLYKEGSEKFSHCYVDTTDPELILDAMENYVRQGKMNDVAHFLSEDGRTISNPTTFRIKLDSTLGQGGLEAEMKDLF